jgi:hypothetical protein
MNWLTLILTYLPTVLQGVVAVEAALKGAPGVVKKQVILNAIQAGAATAEKIPQQDVAGIGALIDNVVGTLNASGLFTKTTAPPALPV